MGKLLKEIFWGFSGSLALLGFYFLVLRLSGMSWNQSWEQFKGLWLWIITLVVGFGLQVGLYVYLKNCQVPRSGGVVATSGGISGIGMVACCAHHLVEIMSILGLSAVALFLSRFQVQILSLGVIFNFLGLVYMLKLIKKTRSYQSVDLKYPPREDIDKK